MKLVFQSLDCKFFKYGLAGSAIILTFEILSYSINTVYNANLRSFIIGEEPEFVHSNFDYFDITKEQVIFSKLGVDYNGEDGKIFLHF